MATFNTTQLRPSTDVDFHSPSAEVLARIDTFETAGKITSKSLNQISEDQLTKVSSATFNTDGDFNEFKDDVSISDHFAARETYCTDNNITLTLA
jgi:hypothetical protein